MGMKKVGPVRMELVVEQSGIVPGEDFWVGWHIVREKGWHTYWKHPGDVGVPPSLDWSLPEGFSNGELLFCSPEKVKMASIRANGNYGETLFLTKIKVPDSIKVGELITLNAKASWLACSRQCVPGFTNLSIEVEVVDSREYGPAWHPKFEEFRKSLVSSLPEEWEVSAIDKGKFIELQLRNKNGNELAKSRPIFFCSNRLIRSNGNQLFKQKEDSIQLRLERSAWAKKNEQFLSGLIFQKNGWGDGVESKYFSINVPLGSL